jgi:hypothetical protein
VQARRSGLDLARLEIDADPRLGDGHLVDRSTPSVGACAP